MSTGDLKSIGKLTTRIHDSTLSNHTRDAFERIAEEIEQEIAERYIELPVDEDGVPVHIGDTLMGAPCSKWDGERFEVGGLELTACGWDVCDAETCDSIGAGQTRHVKYLTIEDVLRDAIGEYERAPMDDYDAVQRIVAKYADEIREVLGVGE